MTFRRLFLFVEGDDDERFFRSVIEQWLRQMYQDVRFVQFSGLKKEKVRAWLHSVKAMKADYIYVRDQDRYPCATAAKSRVAEILPQIDPERIQIVKAEIESWYCAGVREDDPLGSHEIGRCPETAIVTKEAFESAITGFRIPSKLAVLESFDYETAVRRNESFRRFLRKFVDPCRPIV